ncbi:MAG TPA: hypothetical protein DDZ81_12925 [Acetobacteraceae bacterium]|jgi:hypothetical protein|nr:hypothetical protein [Acetobacteraceae bacterium]
MLPGKYARIYHYHLKKCGGSTLNRWLDSLTSDDRTFDPTWQSSWLLGDWRTEMNIFPSASDTATQHALFHWADVVHSHAALRRFAPPGTLCFTILRDPVERVASQIADWRRLVPADTVAEPDSIRELGADAGRLPIRTFLERYWNREGRMQLDNYLTRSLAAGRIGRQVLRAENAETLLDVALDILEQDYDLVGLLEEFDISRNALCAIAGLPPARPIATLNVSRPDRTIDPEIEDARDILQEATRVDRIVYQRARALFDDRYRTLGETYDARTFERDHASRLLGHLKGGHRDGATRYSVRAPLIGSGFHGRDRAGEPVCAVWTGPETTATLYIPTPPDMQVSLLVWIRGYAADRQREQLRVRVDGHPAVHHLTPCRGYADLLTVDACSVRDFVRLEIELDETVDAMQAGCEGFDDRKRGISFDAYGWRPLRPNCGTRGFA